LDELFLEKSNISSMDGEANHVTSHRNHDFSHTYGDAPYHHNGGVGSRDHDGPVDGVTRSESESESESVEMLGWGALACVEANVGGSRVKIKQAVDGAIGCYLWASSVVLSRYSLIYWNKNAFCLVI
jgi:hypothetical protein